MKAAFYERTGAAAEVLQLGELPDPQPGPGELRVRLRWSGVNPSDEQAFSDFVDRQQMDAGRPPSLVRNGKIADGRRLQTHDSDTS